jgi:hypothetical protein
LLVGELEAVTVGVKVGVQVRTGVRVPGVEVVDGVTVEELMVAGVGVGEGTEEAEGEEGLFFPEQPTIKRALPAKTEIKLRAQNFITPHLNRNFPDNFVL